ncbi:hypothetical protein B0J12DRAFT_690563 [Macrophomina phaseolina]|uniref:BZIP domain-containing protein n=1 Tax=Macrophomina phaseolina TaxID=35725 RepID=A0ABQ8FQF6_9PEZI|nr:hypothetical protein B0J12DRAFT_690563 [Macrophomina phaseolina]
MEHSVTPPLSSTLSEGEANRVGDHPDHVDAEAEAKANKQRRKVQNRKNQRARRLRIREQGPGSVQTSCPFRVRRWRLDEPDDCASRDDSSASKGGVLRGPPLSAPVHAQTSLTPPSFIFPLSTDHLLHLIQYNVFRAFVSNKRTLNTLLTGWTDNPPSPTTCPISGPYRDDTAVFPLNPNIPLSLINLFPFPGVRDNLIRREGSFDHWELLQDLIGKLISATPAQKRRGTPLTITVSDPKAVGTVPLTAGRDEDEVTAGRKELIVWGEPYNMQSWEATPGFLTKWSWIVEGCDDLVESSNRWRLMRGEEPLRFSRSKS